MNRRQFLTTLVAFGASVVLVGKRCLASTGVRKLTIADIFTVGFEEARADRLAQYNGWLSREAAQLAHEGRLLKGALGTHVLWAPDYSADGPVEFKRTEVEAIEGWAVWSKEDDVRYSTKEEKIDFVARLLDNVFDTMDASLIGRLGTGRALVSAEYFMQKTEVRELPNAAAYAVNLYSFASFNNV